MPKISVIIPLYNKEKDILNTLDSLLLQSFIDFEAIVVNDGSTDRSAEIVAGVEDDRIRLFNKPNEGVSVARNFGVQQATAPYVAFLDADDYWYPFHLKNINELIIEYTHCQWFATAYKKKYSNKKSVIMSSPVMETQKKNLIVTNYFENSLANTLAWTSAVVMNKDFFTQLGGFNHSITAGAGEDTDLWIKAALQQPLAFCTQVSAIHNLEGSNRISLTPTRNRNFMNLDQYETAQPSNPFLKKYLDLNRYSFALQHKLAGDQESYYRYVAAMDKGNLNKKQRFLLHQPVFVIRLLYGVKNLLFRFGIHLSAFK